MIERRLHDRVNGMLGQFKIVSVSGPRQSGKTTLCRRVFAGKPDVLLDLPEWKALATEDPNGFLNRFPDGVFLDEVQQAPELFPYLKARADHSDAPGLYLLSGSQNYLLQSKVSESLAGRAGLLELLPLAQGELRDAGLLKGTWEEEAYLGGYPAVRAGQIPPADFYNSYLATYLERDVRQLTGVKDLLAFRRAMQLLAGRTGQELNLSQVGQEAGVDHKTISAWLSVLEAGYIAFRLPPYYRNFNKRLTKTPKLYFYDTGLACALLGIRTGQDLAWHPARGAIFENYVVSEAVKASTNQGKRPAFYFLRQGGGVEIDLLWESGPDLVGVEIKVSETYRSNMADNLLRFQQWAGVPLSLNVVYAGEITGAAGNGLTLHHWSNVERLVVSEG